MRACARVLLVASLTASGSLPGLAAPKGQAPEREAQYDRLGRLVYSPTSGRHHYDDSDGAAPAPAQGTIRRRLAAPMTQSLALNAAAPAASSVASAAGSAPSVAAGSSLVVKPEWFRIASGQGIGLAGLRIADIDADGQAEIVSGAWAASQVTTRTWYVLSRQDTEYVQEWANLPYPEEIASVRVAQADADAPLEVLVGAGGQILVYDGASHALERTLTTGATRISGLSVTDVDADGALELVFCDPQRLFIHDLTTGALEFQGEGLGGQDLEVGQADTDPALEIAVANGLSTGFLVDGGSRAVEWSQPGGFGSFVRLGDLDGDGVAELVAGFAWDHLAVYDTASRSLRYELPVFNLGAVRLADVEGDGALELLYGDAQWGYVHVLDGASGAEKWRLVNPEHGVTDIAVGDTDGDGVAEVVWGAGHTSSGPDHLYVADGASHAIEWQSLDESGPHYGFAHGDIDADGALEIVHTSLTSDSGYEDGLYFVHDWATKALEHRSGPLSPSNATGVWRVRAANLDADPQLELLVTSGANVYQGAVYCVDGLTHEVQWRAAVDDGDAVNALQVADLEGDGTLEVVAGVDPAHSGAPGYFLYVFDGATGALEWRSQPQSGLWPYGGLLRVANVDGDAQLEIVTASHGSGALEVVDGLTRAIQLSAPDLDATALDVVDRDGDGRGEIIVGTWKGQIELIDPATGARQEIGSFGSYDDIDGLAVADLTDDGTADLVFCLRGRLLVVDGSSGDTVFQSEELASGLGSYDSLTVADIDGDGTAEIAVNLSGYGLIVFEATLEADTQAPSVSLISPSPGPVSGTVLLQATASDDRGVTQVAFYLDDELLGADASAPYSYSWPTATAAPGNRLLSARAWDAAGNVGTSADVTVSVPDLAPPTVQLTQPSGGSTVSGTVTLAATASDNVGVSRVDFFVDSVLRGSDTTAPYGLSWDTTAAANGTHSLHARAYDAAGNSAPSPLVSVVVANLGPGAALYDPGLGVPRCSNVASLCDSGSLLVGRGPLGPELHQPNTVGGSCADGTGGTFHSDESSDRLQVSTLDGTPFAPGKTVQVRSTVWAWIGFSSDKLDLYSAANAMSPVWTYRGTLAPSSSGAQVLTTTFTLPVGTVQAVRARFRYGGSATPCGSGSYNDHDDLVFAVAEGADTPPVVSIRAPVSGATVAGTVGVEAQASDESGVLRVEFLVDGQLRFTDTVAPWYFPWDTTVFPNGGHTLVARAYDTTGNSGQSGSVSVTIVNDIAGNAVYDPALRAPACAGAVNVCDSGTLLVGRGTVGPEPNQPNTILGSCADSNDGAFHGDESNDRIRVLSVDGTPLAAGKTVRVEATVWAWSGGGDYLDLYSTGQAQSPAWTLVTSLATTQSGAQTLSATYTLPSGALQAVRARFRYRGAAASCSVGAYTDHDDLVFAVQP